VSAGVSVTLERLVLTPSETRAILSFDPLDDELSWQALSTLKADGVSRTSDGQWNLDERTTAHSFLENLSERHGRWTLTVTELVGWVKQPVLGQPALQERLAGPWVFRFEVPAGTDAP